MSEAKFTKGEWWTDERYSMFLGVSGNEGVICDVTCSMDDFYISPTSKELANAHLIAAAPEMYEMLESVMQNAAMGSPLAVKISRLLAKARGE